MKNVTCALVVGSLMYAHVWTRYISQLEFWEDIRIMQVLTTGKLQRRQ